MTKHKELKPSQRLGEQMQPYSNTLFAPLLIGNGTSRSKSKESGADLPIRGKFFRALNGPLFILLCCGSHFQAPMLKDD